MKGQSAQTTISSLLSIQSDEEIKTVVDRQLDIVRRFSLNDIGKFYLRDRCSDSVKDMCWERERRIADVSSVNVR